jgi:oligopeptide transport system ATP-binding protein
LEEILINIKNLKTYFYQRKGIIAKFLGQKLITIRAVDGVNLDIKKGRIFGLVGESGCGKSTLGESIFRLVEPLEGEILYKGRDLLKMDKKSLRITRQRMHLIFQDQFGSLNPRMTVAEIVAESFTNNHDGYKKKDVSQKVSELLNLVNLDSKVGLKFPHELSGGQARRIGLARAFGAKPEFIVADEPTSGLDISTAATILNLMKDVKEDLGLSYLWISHNLNQVKYMADDIAIMYLGKVVEKGSASDVFENMAHPYAQALISAMPKVEFIDSGKRIVLSGEVPSPLNPPDGCRFHTRCPHAFNRCVDEEPQLKDLGSRHFVACHLVDK